MKLGIILIYFVSICVCINAQILLRRFGGMTYEELSAHKANLIKA